MRIAVTGAGGFLGRALAAQLAELGLAGETLLLDRAPFDVPDFACMQADLMADAEALSLLSEAEIVCHLVALPGGAAEADPATSRRINCDLPLALIERLSGRRLILASSIAVYGEPTGGMVDDDTPARSNSVYGAHKHMSEIAFADAVRREAISGMALRLPGIVARPSSSTGFGSAFLSDIFHAARQGAAYRLPVGPDATSWIVSAQACARQLAHAMFSPDTARDSLLLPATYVSMAVLVAELGRQGDASRITYDERADVRRLFGSYPPLRAERAKALGFEGAESITELVKGALAGC